MTRIEYILYALVGALIMFTLLDSLKHARLSRRLRALEEVAIERDNQLWNRLNAQRGDIEKLKKDMYGENRS